MTMISGDKFIITPQRLHDDSISLARSILDDGYIPDVIIGTPPRHVPIAMYMHECMQVDSDKVISFIPIIAKVFNIDNSRSPIELSGLDYVRNHLVSETVSKAKAIKVLVVDDIADTGETLEEICKVLSVLSKKLPHPLNVKTSVVHMSAIKPKIVDYFRHDVDEGTWLVYPHEHVKLNN